MVEALKFCIGDIDCCVSVTDVVEIVKKNDISSIPNSPDYIEGIMEWREGSLKIVNPKNLFDIKKENSCDNQRIIVFDDSKTLEDSEEQIGWLVDSVDEVTTFSTEEVDRSISHDVERVKGIVKKDIDNENKSLDADEENDKDKDNKFVLWVEF